MGRGAAAGEILGAWFEAQRLLVVTDAGLPRAGVLDPALASLAAAGFATEVFDAVTADPPESVLLDCVAQARAAGTEIALDLGGGSSWDMAKLAAVLAISDPPSAAHACRWCRCRPRPGPASEVTNITILTTGESWGWRPNGCRSSRPMP